MCHPPGDSDSESVTIAFWLHLPTQRYIGCHSFTKSLQTQMTQTHIPSFTDFFLMKTQEWKDCYAYRNIGIRGSNAKYETGMKELSAVVRQKLVYLHWSTSIEHAISFTHILHGMDDLCKMCPMCVKITSFASITHVWVTQFRLRGHYNRATEGTKPRVSSACNCYSVSSIILHSANYLPSLQTNRYQISKITTKATVHGVSDLINHLGSPQLLSS